MSAYTKEEFDKDVERISESIKRGEASVDDLARAQADYAAGVKGYTAKLEQSGKALASSMMGLGRSMIDGKTGATQYNDMLSKGADAISDFASRFGILGMVIGAVIKAATAYATEVNKQADALYKSYQDLNQVGAMGAGGMKDVFETMRKFGYGIEQLGDLSALIKENASSLSTFGGTVAEGTQAAANLADSINKSDLARTFMNMGINIDGINKGAMSYIKLQASMGRTSQDVGEELRSGTVDYITQLKILSRITGDTAEAQQAKMDEAMKDEAFNYTMDDLQRRAKAGDDNAKNQFEKINAMIQSGMPAEAIKGAVLGIGGDLSNTETQKLQRTMPEFFAQLMDESKKVGETMNTGVKESTALIKNAGGLTQMHAWGSSFINYSQLKQWSQGGRLWTDREKAAEGAAVATDDATNSYTDMTISNLQARDSAQKLINDGIVPVTKGMAALAKVTAGVAGIADPNGKRIGGTGVDADSGKKDTYGSGGAVDDALSGAIVTNNVSATAVTNNATVNAPSKGSTTAVPAPAAPAAATEPSKQAAAPAAPLPAGRAGSPSANLAAQGGVPSKANGGVVSGPKSGFKAILHGTEAVVPLPDGKSIPVQMPDTGGIIAEQNQILSHQLASITELIGVVRNQVSVSTKILQSSR